MQDKKLYQLILGLNSPWTVSEVKLKLKDEKIQVRVEYPVDTKFCCPECQKQLACYDHAEDRRWRHFDSCQFKTILIAGFPQLIQEQLQSVEAIATSKTSKAQCCFTAVD